MISVSSRQQLREELQRTGAGARDGSGRVALVPTMGALHEGHLALVDRARARADRVVLSVFVNPLQFGLGEDYAVYPRPLERDAALAEASGVDIFFSPSQAELYPGGEPVVSIVPGVIGERLCGAYRPGHFRGVLTVVAKLFNIVRPDVAVFGQKDFQQAVLIRRMVADLDMAVEIDVSPTVREADGLALSSRNSFLAPQERRAAASLYRGLRAAASAFEADEREAGSLLEHARRTIAEEPSVVLQYLALVDPDALEQVPLAQVGSVLAVAAHVGRTRLIDNLILG